MAKRRGLPPFFTEMRVVCMQDGLAFMKRLYTRTKDMKNDLMVACGVDQWESVERVTSRLDPLDLPSADAYYREKNNKKKLKIDERLPAKLLAFRDSAKGGQYALQVFWANMETLSAYRVNLQFIYILGRATTTLKRLRRRALLRAAKPCDTKESDTRASAAKAAETKLVQQVLQAFGRLVNASCLTAYHWDRPSNRISLIHQWQLRYPAAMHGTSFRAELPRRTLFDEPTSETTESYPRMVPLPKGRQGFHTREGIERCWAFRFAWDRGRMAVFLNWRAGETPRFHPRPCCEDLLGEPVELDIRDVELASRQLAGWLAEWSFDLNEALQEFPACQPRNVIEQLAGAAKSGIGTDSGRLALESAMTTFVDLKSGRHCSVHEVSETADADGLPEYKLHFKPLEPGSHYIRPGSKGIIPREGKSTFDVSSVPQDTLVQESVCAQSLRWRTSVFAPDIQEACCQHPPPTENSLKWSDLSVRHEGDAHSGEIVAPITWKAAGSEQDQIRAVLNLEAMEAGSIERHHLRRAEVASRLFARLRECESGSAEAKKFIGSITSGATGIGDTRTLLKRLTDWALKNAGADLAYVLVYDHDKRSFHPFVASASGPFLEQYLKQVYKLSATAVVSCMHDTKAVCEDSLLHRLVPKRRGRSWQVFRNVEPLEIRYVAGNLDPAVSKFSLEYFLHGRLVALPLASEVSAHPDGILWLRWVASNSRIRESSLDELRERMAPVLETVAAIYLVYWSCGMHPYHVAASRV